MNYLMTVIDEERNICKYRMTEAEAKTIQKFLDLKLNNDVDTILEILTDFGDRYNITIKPEDSDVNEF